VATSDTPVAGADGGQTEEIADLDRHQVVDAPALRQRAA
jgi:hypothetical protein